MPEEDITSFISRKAKEHGVDEDLVYSVIKHESAGNPKAMSGAGAKGLMQLMPETAKSLGVKNIDDPYENVDGGIRYLSQLQKKYKSPELTAAAYNAGPGNVDKYKGVPPFKETQNYSRNVSKSYYTAKAKRGGPVEHSPLDPSLPAYGNDADPNAPLATPKKEIKEEPKEGVATLLARAKDPGFQYKPIWEKQKQASEAFDNDFKDLLDQMDAPTRKKAEEMLKKTFVKTVVPEDAKARVEDVGRGLRVAGEAAVREIPRVIEAGQNTVRALTGNTKSIIPKANYVEDSKKIIPELASPEEIQARTMKGPMGIPLSLETFAGAALPYAATGIAGGVAKAAGAGAKIPSALKAVTQTALPLLPTTSAATSIAQGASGGVQSAISEAVKQDKEINLPEVLAAGGASGVAAALPIVGGKMVGSTWNAGKQAIAKNVIKKIQSGVESKPTVSVTRLSKYTPDATTVETAPKTKVSLAEGKLSRFKDAESSLVNKTNIDKKLNLRGAVSKFIKEEKGSVDLDPKLIQDTVQGAKELPIKMKTYFHEPLRTLEQSGYKGVTEPIRKTFARTSRYFGDVEKPFLTALSELPVAKEEYLKIAQVLDEVDVNKLINDTQIDHETWKQLTPEAKAWTSLFAEFFKNSADYLGFPEQARLGEYIPYMKLQDGTLGDYHLAQMTERADTYPGFTYKRTDGSTGYTAAAENLPQIAMRYGNGVRRKLLADSVGTQVKDLSTEKMTDTSFKQALDEANVKGDLKAVKALETVSQNLKKIYDPNEFEQEFNGLMQNWVEHTLRNNISSSLLNSTQTLQLLLPEVGFKTYADSWNLLTGENKSTIWDLLNKLDLDQTSGAKYDLQQSFRKDIDPNQSLQQFAKEANPGVELDTFSALEKYLNQPMALVSGMLKKAGSKETLLQQINNINEAMQSSDTTKRLAAQTMLDELIAEGQKMNQRVNFVRTQADRPQYENSQIGKLVLPLVNYPIKEAGWIADTIYNIVKNPEGSPARMDSVRTLMGYGAIKSLLAGPKTAGRAVLLAPNAVIGMLRNSAPEIYAELEDSLTAIDDHYPDLKNILGVDESGSLNPFDPSDPKQILNAPFLQNFTRAVMDLPGLASETKSFDDKVQIASRFAKFFPVVNVPLGKVKLPLALGQPQEIYKGIRSAESGVRSVKGREFPTDLREEAKGILGPHSEDRAAFEEDKVRNDAKDLVRKGVAPSKTQVRELTRAKKGDELAEDSGQQALTIQSIKDGIIDEVRNAYDKARRTGNVEDETKHGATLKELGVNVNKHNRRVDAHKRMTPARIRKAQREVRSLTRN